LQRSNSLFTQDFTDFPHGAAGGDHIVYQHHMLIVQIFMTGKRLAQIPLSFPLGQALLRRCTPVAAQGIGQKIAVQPSRQRTGEQFTLIIAA